MYDEVSTHYNVVTKDLDKIKGKAKEYNNRLEANEVITKLRNDTVVYPLEIGQLKTNVQHALNWLQSGATDINLKLDESKLNTYFENHKKYIKENYDKIAPYPTLKQEADKISQNFTELYNEVKKMIDDAYKLLEKNKEAEKKAKEDADRLAAEKKAEEKLKEENVGEPNARQFKTPTIYNPVQPTIFQSELKGYSINNPSKYSNWMDGMALCALGDKIEKGIFDKCKQETNNDERIKFIANFFETHKIRMMDDATNIEDIKYTVQDLKNTGSQQSFSLYLGAIYEFLKINNLLSQKGGYRYIRYKIKK